MKPRPDTPQVDAAALPPNSFVNLSNPAQLAAYAQSQGLPPDANTTRPCSCECLPTWSHMILPDYNSALFPAPRVTTPFAASCVSSAAGRGSDRGC